MIIDTHAHLTDEKLAAELPDFVQQAAEEDVLAMLCVGTTLEDSAKGVELAEKYPQIRAAVGLHPNTCCSAANGDWEKILELSKHPQVAALGETGLDRYWDDCPWDIQVDNFRRHLNASRDTQLPVVIHTRDCAEETLEVLKSEHDGTDLLGVMHSFTGPQSVADGCLELGLYVSFAGMVTFKNAQDIRDIAASIPLDRILVETDSPYLTPHPYRGQRPNHPAMVAQTLACIAEVRGISVQEMAQASTENAERLFGKWELPS